MCLSRARLSITKIIPRVEIQQENWQSTELQNISWIFFSIRFFAKLIVLCFDVATVQLAVHEIYYGLRPDSQQIICPTKCQHFGKYRENRLCDLQVFNNLPFYQRIDYYCMQGCGSGNF